jgi:5-methyltetrahydropteroyltriglutamate--homocysteine methyltransferase
LLPTTLVGSYPQPDWLIDKDMLTCKPPPRVPMTDVWKVASEHRLEAQDDAVRITAFELERAGLDILTDGEVRRESYFNRFANALSGIDPDNPGEALSRAGRPTRVPRVTGPIERTAPVLVRDVEFLRGVTDKPIKVTVPGAFTMTRLVQDDYYLDEDALIAAYANAVNSELKDLKRAGADIVQLDEPYLQSNAEEARARGLNAIDMALDGIEGETAVHLCFGYAYVVSEKPSGYAFLAELDACAASQISVEAAQPGLDPTILGQLPSKTIIYGVLDLNAAPETPETVASRIRAALNHVPADRLVVAPDCGMKYLGRDIAFAKLQAMTEGANLVRAEIMG